MHIALSRKIYFYRKYKNANKNISTSSVDCERSYVKNDIARRLNWVNFERICDTGNKGHAKNGIERRLN